VGVLRRLANRLDSSPPATLTVSGEPYGRVYYTQDAHTVGSGTALSATVRLWR
jgi:hypothetical protein